MPTLNRIAAMYNKSYIILTSRSLSDLEIMVNETIKKGYTPQGGVCSSVRHLVMQAVNEYSQAMVLKEEPLSTPSSNVIKVGAIVQPLEPKTKTA